ncbi:MAG: DUF1643 domain-containing protein [Sulfurovum sp.]|nr:DUF1643 domain-containing protein [Sulfurovaceae bacterium]
MVNQALFSNKKDYRYMLSRIWDTEKPTLGIIGLKPLIGDAINSDLDINHQVRVAKALGYGSLYSVNIFSFIEKDGVTIYDTDDPIGINNDRYLRRYLSRCKIIICAWGNEGGYRERSTYIKKLSLDLYYLKLNKTGEPAHISHISGNFTPISF